MPEATLNKTLASLVNVKNHSLITALPNLFTSWESMKKDIAAKEREKNILGFLPNITKDGLLNFLKTRLLRSSPSRLKYSLHVNPKYPGKVYPSTYTFGDCGTLITLPIPKGGSLKILMGILIQQNEINLVTI
ncbi:hypothetical protein DSO57_1010154 [Entomophthora muscae]|uniref:Uncharacterized protein n=1 Tax=Entomophthora muscae TaxID=34485 RepID=A0ACC2UG96_9FUNG|nr:hypothetical protein DSO57_1010154 [Entomophthora muscae]